MALRQRVSFDEFMSLPEERPYREYINGEIKVKSLPTFPHSLTQSELSRRLNEWSDSPGGFVLSEQRCILNGSERTYTLLPDVAYFPSEGFPVNPRGDVMVAPLLAVEILSPGDTYGDVEAKVTAYLDAGVVLVWIIDPLARNLTRHGVGQRPILIEEDGELEEAGLPGFRLSLADLFRKLP